MHNQALDAEPPVEAYLKSMLIGGGLVKAAVRGELKRILEMHKLTRYEHAPVSRFGANFDATKDVSEIAK